MLDAIRKFDPKFNKTFTRFFELLLVRKFLTLLKKANKPLAILSEEIINTIVVEEPETYYITSKHVEKAQEVLTESEFNVFYEHYVMNRKIINISKLFGMKEKRVYNALYRIKIKLRCFKEISWQYSLSLVYFYSVKGRKNMRKKIILVCTECLSRNYNVEKNTQVAERLELKKYCKKCNKHTLHKETK